MKEHLIWSNPIDHGAEWTSDARRRLDRGWLAHAYGERQNSGSLADIGHRSLLAPLNDQILDVEHPDVADRTDQVPGVSSRKRKADDADYHNDPKRNTATKLVDLGQASTA